MRVMLELWGEYPELAMAETRGILVGEGISYSIVEKDFPVVILETKEWEPLKRGGLLRRISQHISTSMDIPEINLQLDDFAVRARRYMGLRDISAAMLEREIGRRIKGRVNLSFPKHVVRVAIARKIHVGIELYNTSSESFESRRAKNLPVSYPITMHPRLARAMVNLARVPRGARILDPFCGTGSILIEAGLLGMRIYGSDIDERMIEASRINLRKFGLKAELESKDVGEIEGKYDAIVTDPPYGKSSSTRGEDVYQLYERAFKKFQEISSKVVISLPDQRSIKIGEKYFDLVEMYPLRVHKSLTRYFSYFRI